MFSSSPFGQSSSSSPFGSQSAFGQPSNANNLFAPKPFGSTTPFGAQTGFSIFCGTSTGGFGTTQPPSPFSSTPAFGASSSPAFGSSAPAFGATSTPPFGSTTSAFGGASLLGQKPAFGGFGSPSQASPFGSTKQQSQPAFGSNIFGSSPAFGASSQPAFGSASTPAFGSTSTSAFGATAPAFGGAGSAFGVTSTPAFGSTATSAFGSTGSAFGASTGGTFGASSTPPFGSTTTNAFGASSTPLFGAVGTPAFGASSTPAFGATSTPAFGASSMPAFGASSTPSFSFGSSPAFGQSTAAFGSSPFGSTSSPFGSQPGTQATTPTFGGTGFGQSPFGGQRGGIRVAPYTQTTETDSSSGRQPAGKLESISAMPVYKDKSHEELRWEDYQLGDKGGPNPAGQSGGAIGFGATSSTPAFCQPSPFGSISTQSTPLFSTMTPTFGQTGSAFGQTTSSFGQTTSPFGQPSAPSFGQTNLFSTPSGFGTNIFSSSTPSLIPSSSQSTPSSFATSFQPSQPAQTTNAFGLGNFGQTQIDLEEDPQANLVARPHLPSREPLPGDSIELLVDVGSAESGEELTATSQPQPAPLSITILEESFPLQIVESPPGSKQEFEQRVSEEPMIPRTEGCITLILSPKLELPQRSAGDSSLRARRSTVYPLEIEELVLQLHELLQQESFTKDSFADMAAILQRFEGRLLPIALGSACSLLKRDFWQSWDEYEEAFSHREVVLQYYNNPQEPSLLDLIGTCVQQDKEVDSIESELLAMDAEIARLQAKRELLNESLVAARNCAEETATQLDQERHKREERDQQYIELRANAARIEVKNNVRRLVLNDLNMALDALMLCDV